MDRISDRLGAPSAPDHISPPAPGRRYGRRPGRLPAPAVYETIGIEILQVEPGHAVGRLALDESVSASPSTLVAHGGAVASLADSVGYWAVTAANDFATTPTVDLRLDFLAPATDDLTATATVTRNGSSVGTVDVDVETADDLVAVARGGFKTGGGEGESAGDAPDR